MIKCKVTKKIMQESGTIMGLSIIQIVTLIIGCIVTIGSLLLLWLVLKVGIDAVMWIVFLELVLFIGFGVVRIQGMSVLKFITSNSTQKRPYNSKGLSAMTNVLLCRNRHRIQYRFMKCTITDCFLQELTRLR